MFPELNEFLLGMYRPSIPMIVTECLAGILTFVVAVFLVRTYKSVSISQVRIARKRRVDPQVKHWTRIVVRTTRQRYARLLCVLVYSAGITLFNLLLPEKNEVYFTLVVARRETPVLGWMLTCIVVSPVILAVASLLLMVYLFISTSGRNLSDGELMHFVQNPEAFGPKNAPHELKMRERQPGDLHREN